MKTQRKTGNSTFFSTKVFIRCHNLFTLLRGIQHKMVFLVVAIWSLSRERYDPLHLLPVDKDTFSFGTVQLDMAVPEYSPAYVGILEAEIEQLHESLQVMYDWTSCSTGREFYWARSNFLHLTKMFSSTLHLSCFVHVHSKWNLWNKNGNIN